MKHGIIDIIKEALTMVESAQAFESEQIAAIRTSLNEIAEMMDKEELKDQPTPDERFYQIKLNGIQSKINALHKELTDKGALTEREKSAYSYISSVLDPLKALSDNIEAGKAINEAANDFSFLLTYFGPQMTFNNPENYVPGQISYEDGDIQRAANDYKLALKVYKDNAIKNISSLAKDELNPVGSLNAKLDVIKAIGFGFLPDLNKERQKNKQAPLRNPMIDIYDAYSHLVETLNSESIKDLSNAYIQSAGFFEQTMGHIFDPTYFESQMNVELKDHIKPEVAGIIKKSVKPLRISRSIKEVGSNGKETTKTVYIGMTDSVLETLEKSSALMQVLYQCQYSLSNEYPDEVKNPNNKLHDLNNTLLQYNDKITAYLRGDKDAPAPTREDMEAAISKIGTTLLSFDTNTNSKTKDDSTALFNRDGMTESAMILNGTLKAVGETSEYFKPLAHKYFNDVKERVQKARIEKKEMAIQASPETEQEFRQLDNFFNGFKDMYNNGFITLDDYYQDMLTEMAASPQYNEHVKSVLEKEIKNLADAELTTNKYLKKYDPQHYIITTDRDKRNLEVPLEEKSLNQEQIRTSLYKMYLSSLLIKKEHSKIDALNKSKATFENMVKGTANPVIQDLTKAVKISEERLKNTTEYFDNILTSEAFENLGYIKAHELQKCIAEEKPIEDLVKMGAERHAEVLDSREMGLNLENATKHKDARSYENQIVTQMDDFYKGLDAATKDALSQNSSVLNKSNSDEYNAIGKAMARINTNKEAGIGATKNDYMALLNACTHYVYTHNSNPATSIGKDRFNAAAKIAANLSFQMQKLSQNSPNQLEQFKEDAQINMIRSKVFRDEYVALAKADREAILKSGDIGDLSEIQRMNLDIANRALLHAEVIGSELPKSEINKEFSKKIENGKDFDSFMKKIKPQMDRVEHLMAHPEEKYVKPEIEAPVLQNENLPGLK